MVKAIFPGDVVLPTIFRAYKPIEEYLELLRDTTAAPAPTEVSPIDALIVNLLATMCSGRPTLVDLAAEATLGASTVLCCTQTNAWRVFRRASSTATEPWPSILAGFLERRQADGLVAQQELLGNDLPVHPRQLRIQAANIDPTLVLMTTSGQSPEALVGRVRDWLTQRMDALVLIMGLEATGQCEFIKELAAGFAHLAPERFLLLRERSEAWHSSSLGLIHHGTHPYVEPVLTRMAALFTGNYSYLGMLLKTCEDAVRAADVDQTVLLGPPLGSPHMGDRRRIAELESSLNAIAAEGITGAVRRLWFATKRKVRDSVAPTGTARYRYLTAVLRVVQLRGRAA